MERAMAPHHWVSGILGLVGCLISSGCSSVSKGEVALDLGIKDRGVASWYGKEFHGRVAANGEVFDMTAMTAAHRKLPLGSLVRVVNLINGKQVQLRINDRGPYVIGRMLDVSHAAAVELGMVEAGTSIIHLEVIGRHRAIDPVMQVPNSVIGGKLLQVEQALPERSEDLRAQPFVSEMKTPPPMERFFPREVLYGRRERRHAAMLAASHTANPIPTRVVG